MTTIIADYYGKILRITNIFDVFDEALSCLNDNQIVHLGEPGPHSSSEASSAKFNPFSE